MSENTLVGVTMPKWGMVMASGKIVGWLAGPGARIEKGDEILEIETEKTVNVLEANASGTLARLVAGAGDELPVGSLLGVIAQGDTCEEAIDAFIAEFQAGFVPEQEGDAADEEPREITVEGDVTLSWRHFPAKDPSDDTPVILIHGFGGAQNSWVLNIPRLGEARDLYTLDLPGRGASSKDVGDGALADLAHRLSAFMAALAISRAHLVGHSLGASLAATLAARTPEQIASLTLISGLGAGTRVDRSYVEAFLAADRRKSLKACMQRLFANPALVNRAMVEDVLKAKRIEGAQDALQKIAAAAVFGPDAANPAQDLAQLAMPVQIIWGRGDQVSPVGQLAGLPKTITRSIIDDAGHMVHIEAAAQVNDLICGFLDSCAVKP
jgi:pyruvate dehydrogenase E2 component (dihydrolipoamide acetyltransferase)